MFNHTVRTYNHTGMLYEVHFDTAEKAYQEYLSIIEDAKRELPKGYEITVVRYNDGMIMTMETVSR